MNFSQSGERPDRWREPQTLETIPSSPILQASEHGHAVVMRQVLVQAYARPARAQDAGERRLANLERFSAQVGPVEFQQVEGVEEGVRLPSSPAHGALRGEQSSGRLVAALAEAVAAPKADHDPLGTRGRTHSEHHCSITFGFTTPRVGSPARWRRMYSR